MIHSLIDSPDTWDALQIIQRAQQQLWDEFMSIYQIDDTQQKVPHCITTQIFEHPAYLMLDRASAYIRKQGGF